MANITEVTLNDSFKNMFFNRLQCSICQEMLSKPLVINCGHSFCQKCLDQWIEQKGKNSNCPNCRSRILFSTPNQVLYGLIEEFSKLTNSKNEVIENVDTEFPTLRLADHVTITAESEDNSDQDDSDQDESIPDFAEEGEDVEENDTNPVDPNSNPDDSDQEDNEQQDSDPEDSNANDSDPEDNEQQESNQEDSNQDDSDQENSGSEDSNPGNSGSEDSDFEEEYERNLWNQRRISRAFRPANNSRMQVHPYQGRSYRFQLMGPGFKIRMKNYYQHKYQF